MNEYNYLITGTLTEEFKFKNTKALHEFVRLLQIHELEFTVENKTVVVYNIPDDLYIYGTYPLHDTCNYLNDKYKQSLIPKNTFKVLGVVLVITIIVIFAYMLPTIFNPTINVTVPIPDETTLILNSGLNSIVFWVKGLLILVVLLILGTTYYSVKTKFLGDTK